MSRLSNHNAFNIKPNILDWSNINENALEIQKEHVAIGKDDSIISRKEFGMIVPNQANPREGNFLCKTLDAELYVPDTVRCELEGIYKHRLRDRR